VWPDAAPGGLRRRIYWLGGAFSFNDRWAVRQFGPNQYADDPNDWFPMRVAASETVRGGSIALLRVASQGQTALSDTSQTTKFLFIPSPWSPQTLRLTDRIFFVTLAVTFIVINFGLFTVSFLKTDIAQELHSTWVQVHAFLFTSWILLFFAQSVLVASRRVDLHRRLGIAGAILAGLMVVITIISGVSGYYHSPPRPVIDYIMLYIVVHVDAFDFTIFVAAAIYFRRTDPQAHKRLMFLATIAVGSRFPVIGKLLRMDLHHYWDEWAFVLGGIIYDYVSRGRVHRVYIWGGLIILILPIGAELIFDWSVPHLIGIKN
jgi:hypothetical protein